MIFNGFGISYKDVRRWGLDEALAFATVAEIKDVIARLRLPVKKTGKKGELVDRVVDFIKENPKYLVDSLSLDELEITRQVLGGNGLSVLRMYLTRSTFSCSLAGCR